MLSQTAYLLFYEKDFEEERKEIPSVSQPKMNGVKVVAKEVEHNKISEKADKFIDNKEGEHKNKMESIPLRTLDPQPKQL